MYSLLEQEIAELNANCGVTARAHNNFKSAIAWTVALAVIGPLCIYFADPRNEVIYYSAPTLFLCALGSAIWNWRKQRTAWRNAQNIAFKLERAGYSLFMYRYGDEIRAKEGQVPDDFVILDFGRLTPSRLKDIL